ncbi:MAG: hypothetical protein ACI4U0_04170 [Candidatus Aphodocola sp.]|nr:hypothetical protein [Bacilli bacterium]
MAVKTIKETSTGKNIMFQDTGNHHKMTLNEFVKKIESGTSVYSENYYIKHDQSGKTPVSKPNKSKKDNLE